MKAKDIITESHQACPHCGGPLVEYSGLMEKKDACYYKVKASAKVWPSAYASGRLVQCRKKGAANYGNKSESLTEFAAGGGGDAGNYFRELASAWYNGAYDSGSLQKGIKTNQDIERLLQRGVVAPDGKTRKYNIDYNSDFDGVVIFSDDYYEHGDHDETDSRTGKPFGPYDYMEFSDDDLSESANPGQQAAIAIAKQESGKYSKQDGHRLREDDTVAEGADDKFSVADKVEDLVDQYRLYDKRGWTDLFTKLAGRKLEVAEIRREMEYASKFLQLLDSIRMRSDYRGQQDPRKDQELIDLSNQWLSMFNKATGEFKGISGQGVAEGIEQVYKILAVSKSNALGKKVKLNVKASSLEEVFERLAASDWYPLDINGVEVINGKRLKQGVAEEWSQKYKSSINCSHPKGFSQKAHCAGKKKHNESIEMEMTCPDCGMCETHGDHSGDTLDEACGQDALARILELGGIQLTEQLTADQQFDMIEEMVEQLAEQHGVDADEIWEDFESVDDHELLETAAWRRSAGKSKKGGLNAKGVASYRRENPGSHLQMAVTTKPSKLKPGSKAAKRRKSFCARMGGVKGPMKKPNGKPTRKALALRKWNC